MILNIIIWLIVGGIAGWIANRLMGRRGEGIGTDIIVGILGSIIGGAVFSLLGGPSVTAGLNLYSIVIAIIGSIILIAIINAIRGLMNMT